MKKTIIGFVNDKRQYTNDRHSKILVTVATNLQYITQGWEYVLHTSGGQLKIIQMHLLLY